METSEKLFFEKKVLVHYDYLKCYLRTISDDKELAEDLSQETMAKAWEKINLLMSYDNIKAALKTIGTNLLLNHKKNKKSQEIPVLATTIERISPSEKDNLFYVLNEESRRDTLAAIGMLKQTQRRIVLLKYYYNMNFKSISEILEMNYNTVLSHHRRAILQLKKIFERKNKIAR